MKKQLFFLVSFVSLSLFANIKVACVGDSITYGARIEHRDQQSYPSQLSRMLGNKFTVKNFGVSGRTLLKKGNLPYWKTGQYLAALKWQPDFVIIKLGTNDTKLNNWKYKADFEKDLTELANSFVNLESKPKVYLAYPAPAFCFGNQIDGKRVANEVVPFIKNVAKNLSLPIIDFHTLLLKDKNLFPDTIHPNAEGAFKLAKESYKKITLQNFNGSYKVLRAQVLGRIGNIEATISDFYGFKKYSFSLNGAFCVIVAPHKVAKGHPWFWRARFFGHQPQTDLALLKKGFHIAYCDISAFFGAQKAIERWNKFYTFATDKLQFSKKVSLEGMSRGGLIIFNWANANPTKVNCIYGDAPVMDFKSWPGGLGTGKGSPANWVKCQQIYGFKTLEEAKQWHQNPVDHASNLAKHRISVIFVYGKVDKVVPPSENCLIFAESFEEIGGEVVVIGKDNNGHHPHSLQDPKPIVDFVLKHTEGL